MKNTSRIFLVFVFIAIALNSQAKEVPGKGTPKMLKSGSQTAESCLPATGHMDLNINNVRARINTGGDMWWDFEIARYEIPKGSSSTSMFSASLWMGGKDENGQLKLAALRYRQVGNDFWPGPLTVDGTASVSAETCKSYDKLFPMTRAEVEEFKGWYADPDAYPDYQIPKSITDWPAHGDMDLGQAFYLAPFYDADGSGDYNPNNGDYPYYDLDNSLCPRYLQAGQRPARARVRNGEPFDTTGILVDQVLKGDQTLWWVFNDKGNAHTETQGQPIGMEIRAQAFAFATNDEINYMTFYTYELINRSTYTLTETYFSQWVDTDLGNHLDDYVGCDVGRGLGYCYNGDDFDEDQGGRKGYGNTPPAVGVDFFQGPYMDPDGLDNKKFHWVLVNDTTTTPPHIDSTYQQVVDESINGVNFGDGIIDNERFGMRRFVYHNNSLSGVPQYMTDPEIAVEYYNFLRGIWKDNTKMLYGGNAHRSSGAYGPECDFMFPGDSDPWLWGTNEQRPNGDAYWTERTAKNPPSDRRFMQSAGPFTLKPGMVNYITVGIPWARATTGGAWASVELLRQIDDKCQALFDNCFKVLDGPDAPDLIAQELDREVILYLQNRKTSNNFKEKYLEFDPNIPDSLEVITTTYEADTVDPNLFHQIIKKETKKFDRYYHFEGYQIFQLKDATVSVSEIYDADKARLVAQCDIKNFDAAGNAIGQLVNYTYSQALQGYVPQEMVNGVNMGISHSFVIKEDQFASGDKRLVNHKKYYYIAVAYGYNQFMKYTQDPGSQQPGISGLTGQKEPYKAGRKSPAGAIKSITVIPHKPEPEAGGTIMNSSYGDGPKITRIEGQGNGGMVLDMTSESIESILTSPDHRIANPVYMNGKGPVNIKIVDPLNIKKADYTIKLVVLNDKIDTARWILEEKDASGNVVNTFYSDTTIAIADEKLFIDDGLGFSITIQQVKKPGDASSVNNGVLQSSISFADSSVRWLSFVYDTDEQGPYNWIRSGTLLELDADGNPTDNCDYYTAFSNGNADGWFDGNKDYQKIVSGGWSPFFMTSIYTDGPGYSFNKRPLNKNKLENIASVDIVFTPDKSKWTRCPVIELGEDPILNEGGKTKFTIRAGQSVDKDGNPDGTGTGMGWFPGYAINIETGERLNMAYGEDSWLQSDNGRDMIFNPTASTMGFPDKVLFGGKHWVYIFSHDADGPIECPAYDEGQWIKSKLTTAAIVDLINVYKSAMWVGCPLSVENTTWLANEVKIRIRIAKPYKKHFSTSGFSVATPENNNYPMYNFTTNDIFTVYNDNPTAKTALDLIKVVPNPYYGFSTYETSQIDNRVKIINLPEECVVTIYSLNGTIIKQFNKGDPSTYVEWDLKNFAGIPISGGVYIVHVKADGVGEKTVKWFGALRPIDLNSF